MFPYLFFFLFSTALADDAIVTEEPDYTVYIFLSEDCPICRYYVPEINRLHKSYASDQIQIIGVFPNFSSKRDKIDQFVSDYDLHIPTKTDYFKVLSKSLEASLTPEVFVVDNHNTVLYKGRIDNAYADIGKRRRVITSRELEDFLIDIQNESIQYKETEAVGCFIHYADFN